jgi:hypothetical protein
MVNIAQETRHRNRIGEITLTLWSGLDGVRDESLTQPPDSRPPAGNQLEFWLLRSGALAESHLPVSRIGIYTDFT